MKNFAEELVYWYLRFNGFFPLTNFVLHRQDLNSDQSVDVDLLGIRPKYVSEDVGGNHHDEYLFNHFSPKTNIGLICEVKSSRQAPSEIPIDRADRLRYSLRRLGFFSEEKVNLHVKSLLKEKVIRGKFHEVGNLLITERGMEKPGFICLLILICCST